MQKITTVGLPQLPMQWEGKIHSVFRSSCNIWTGSGPLLTIHGFDFGMLPRSLYVPDLSTTGLHPGDPVKGDRRGVLLGTRLLEWAEQVEEADTKIPERGELPQTADKAWQLLRQKQSGTENDPLIQEIYQTLRTALDMLWQGLLCNDRACVRTQCAACVGLGQGLTPSGDDMLLGTLTALHMYDPQLVMLLGEELLPLVTRTNDISRSYLELAVQGYAATPVIRAAEHLDGNLETVEILLSVGHSSGCDILEGILTAVQKLKEQEKRERK